MATRAGTDNAVGPAAMQLAPFARQLDRCFDGFRAAVEQVSLIATGAMAQALSEVELSAVVQAVAGVDQRLGLVSQRLDQHLGLWPRLLAALP